MDASRPVIFKKQNGTYRCDRLSELPLVGEACGSFGSVDTLNRSCERNADSLNHPAKFHSSITARNTSKAAAVSNRYLSQINRSNARRFCSVMSTLNLGNVPVRIAATCSGK